MREDVPDGVVEIVVAVIFAGIDVLNEPISRETKRLKQPVFRLYLFAPDLRIIRAGEDHFDLVHLAQSQLRALFG